MPTLWRPEKVEGFSFEMSDENVNVKDKRDGFPIFIHSELDDYGLSAIEFRVYARLARRAGNEHGKARESIPKMAEAFMVSNQTVRRSLQVLKESRLITEQSCSGKPTVYTLNPRSVWQNKKELKIIRDQAFGKTPYITTPTRDVTPSMTDRGPLTSQVGVPLTPQIDEGYPIKEIPLRVSPKETPLPPYRGDNFTEALAEFEAHRVEIRKPLKPVGRKRLYADLSSWGEAEATEALRQAVRSGYQGVFRPKAGNGYGEREHPQAYRPGKIIT